MKEKIGMETLKNLSVWEQAKLCRVLAGIKFEDLAMVIGLTKQYLSSALCGVKDLKVSHMEAIADHLGYKLMLVSKEELQKLSNMDKNTGA